MESRTGGEGSATESNDSWSFQSWLRVGCVVALASIPTVAAGCALLWGGSGACLTVVSYALRVEIKNESGERVVPDRAVVRRQGGEEETLIDTTEGGSAEGYCGDSGPGMRAFREESGQFTVEVTCGDETFTREVRVTSDDCGTNTEEIDVVVPDGACGACGGGGSDAGGDATGDGGDVGVDSADGA